MSDRITVINNDNGSIDVIINGENIDSVFTEKMDKNIHAIQWYGDHGEIEYNDRNEKITDISLFQFLIDEGLAEKDRRDEEQVLEALENEPTEEQIVEDERAIRLFETDWIVIKYIEIGEPIPKKWKEYRNALRNITKQSGYPGHVEWPTKPE